MRLDATQISRDKMGMSDRPATPQGKMAHTSTAERAFPRAATSQYRIARYSAANGIGTSRITGLGG